jgi:hypothetical protein
LFCRGAQHLASISMFDPRYRILAGYVCQALQLAPLIGADCARLPAWRMDCDSAGVGVEIFVQMNYV